MTGRATALTRAHWRLRAGVVVVAGAAIVGTLVVAGLHQDRDHSARSVADVAPPDLTPKKARGTRTRFASFNLLGHNHTKKGGKRKGWASGPKRMNWAVKLINKHKLEIIGFQEMQEPQFRRFSRLMEDRWAVWPGDELTEAAMHNSIAWRRDVWRAVDRQTVQIPYFKGNMIRMPLVKLRHRETGRRTWVFNTHNPANSKGDAWKWRKKGFRIEADLVNSLREAHPNIPVLITGDKNELEKYACRMVKWTDQHGGNGAKLDADSVCVPGAPLRVDWTMASPNVRFTGHKLVNKGLIDKTTDHPLVVSDVKFRRRKS